MLKNRAALVAFMTLLAASALGRCARADLVTSFEDAMKPNGPATGWSYLWNSGGAIGDPTNYTAMHATSDPYAFYDSDGNGTLPRPAPGAYVYLGLVYPNNSTGPNLDPGTPGGHPGLGYNQAGSGGIERYAIAAYTPTIGGDFFIDHSALKNADGSQDGIDLRVFVNANPIFSGSTAHGVGNVLSFDTELGRLRPGDTIYVAIASGATDFSDSFSLRYRINVRPVPEPAGLALLGAGAVLASGWLHFRRSRPGGSPRSVDTLPK